MIALSAIALAATLSASAPSPQPGLRWTLVYEVQTEKIEGGKHEKGNGRSQFLMSLELTDGRRILRIEPQADAQQKQTIELEVDEALQPLRIANWTTIVADRRARVEAMPLTGEMRERAMAQIATATPEAAAHSISPALDILAAAYARVRGRPLPSAAVGSWSVEPTADHIRLTWAREDPGIPIDAATREYLRKVSGKPETVDSLPETTGAGRQTCVYEIDPAFGLVIVATCEFDQGTVYANGGGSGVGRQRTQMTITQSLPETP